MKKSQRLRLAELKSQDASKLSGDDKAELQRLEALAVANPDASKDEDDTKPLTAGEYLAKFTSVFREKAALALENLRIAAQLAVVAAFLGFKTAEMSGKTPEELTAALNSKSGGTVDPKAPTAAEFSTMKTRAESAESELAANRTDDAAFLGVKVESLPKGAARPAAFTARSDLRAAERLKELGFPVDGLPQNKKENAGGDTSDLLARFAAMTDPNERAAFFANSIAPLVDKKTDPSRN